VLGKVSDQNSGRLDDAPTKARARVEELLERQRNLWLFIAESKEAGVPLSPGLARAECSRLNDALAKVWEKVRIAEHMKYAVAMSREELDHDYIATVMRCVWVDDDSVLVDDRINSNGVRRRDGERERFDLGAGAAQRHDWLFENQGGWHFEQKSTGLSPGRPTRGATSSTSIASRLEEHTGHSVETLRASLCRGPKTEHKRAVWERLARVVRELVEARERPVNRSALRDVLGCGTSTIDRLVSAGVAS
jgi:hypothetical protein